MRSIFFNVNQLFNDQTRIKIVKRFNFSFVHVTNLTIQNFSLNSLKCPVLETYVNPGRSGCLTALNIKLMAVHETL